MIDRAESFNSQENGEEPERLAGERPDKSVSDAHLGGLVEYQVDNLVTMSYIIENEYKNQG